VIIFKKIKFLFTK